MLQDERITRCLCQVRYRRIFRGVKNNPNLFGGRAEDDGYANLSARLNLGFQHNNGARSRFIIHSVNAKKEIDGFFDNNGPADQNSRSESSDLYFSLKHDRPSEDGSFEDHFTFSSARFNSENYIDSISAFGPFVQNTRFIGSVKNLNWQRDYYYGIEFLVSVGILNKIMEVVWLMTN